MNTSSSQCPLRSFPLAYARCRLSLTELPAWAADLLIGSRVARLAFADSDGRPRVLPVTFAVADDTIWSAIDRKPKRTAEPARVRWLRRDPRAALVVDRYADDWDQLAWVQVLGTVDLLNLAEGQPGLAALGDKYAQYRAEPPPGPLLRLAVERALCWRAGG